MKFKFHVNFKVNAFPGVHGKSSGVQNDRLGRLSKMDATGNFFFRFFPPVSPRTFRLFSAFFQKVKTGDFVSRFSQWKIRWQKKRSIPRRTARKNEEDSHLRFFIFETLSQRFLQNIFIDFRFFEKTQNRRFCFAIFSMKNASTEKTEYTTTNSAEKRRR